MRTRSGTRTSTESGESTRLVERKMTTRKNLGAFGVFLAVCLAGNVTGFAAAAPVGSVRLGAGDDVVAACQSTPISVGFDAGYDLVLTDYGVTTVRLTGLDTRPVTGCGGYRFQLAISDSQGTLLTEYAGTTPLSGTTLLVDLSSTHVRVADVASIHLMVSS